MNNKNKVYKVEYAWKINNYSYYDAKGEDLCSPVFSAANREGYKWFLKFKFHDPFLDCIALFVYADYIGKNGKIFARFRFTILNGLQEEIYDLQSQIRSFELNSTVGGWGFEKTIKRKKLLDSKLLPNDELTVYCAIIFSKGDNFTDDFDRRISMQLQNQCMDYTLPKNLGSLLLNQDFSDIVLSVNGKNYHAHKYILAARSPVFYAMFSQNMQESKTNHVEISDIDEEIVEQMLNYIYTDKCENMQELAEGLFVAADKYDLKGLKLNCEKKLLENLSVENATKILILAEMHGANELKFKTIRFIVANSVEIVNRETWNEMVVSHPLLFNEVFKGLINKFVT